MENVGEIQSKMDNLNEVILNSNRTFHIPDFQRDFVWTNGEAEELFQDFAEDTNSFETETKDLQGYLLGNIVLINAGETWLVVDGQQRLTTLTLIFKALFENVKKRALDEQDPNHRRWLQRLGDLEKGFNKLDDAGEFVGLRITHESSLPFGPYYRDLIRDSKDAEPSTVSDENIESVYNTISEQIQTLNDQQLARFIVYLRTKVKLIVTTAPSQAKAFQLFEVLNDRGRSLEPLDLVKNLLLKQLSVAGYRKDDMEDFNNNWSSFLKNLQISSKRKISSSTFMKHFVAGEYGKNIKQNDLFEFFDEEEKGSYRIPANEIITFSKKLVKYSQFYQAIEKNPSENIFSKHQNMFILFKLLGVKQFHPLLMNFYDSEQYVKDKVLDACVRYAASIIFSYTQTNFIEKEIPALIKSIKNNQMSDDEKAEHIVSQINKLIEERVKVLRSIIPTKNFANAQGNTQKKAGDLLKYIELYFNNNTSIIKTPNGRKISIEHILSRSLSIDPIEYGFSNSEEHKEYLNHIGNLTLLYSDENTSASNGTFENKINTYEKTDFIITKTIVKNIETSIKGGKTTMQTNLINEYQPLYITHSEEEETKIWNKESIDKRGEKIAWLLSDLLTNKIDFN